MFKVLDLFSGIGGFALATEWAGGKTIAFAEIADYPSRILARHWPGVWNCGDVTKLCRRLYDCERTGDDEFWCPRCDMEFGECDCIGTDQFTDTVGFPDVIVGGVPCQPASQVGEQRGTDDERWLWPDVLRIVGELGPDFVLLENPRALLQLEGGGAFRGILEGFAGCGYDVQWDVVPAGAVGAGHYRERLFILATYAHSPRLEGHPGNAFTGSAAGRRGSEPDGHFAKGDLRTRRIKERRWYRESGIVPVR